MQGPGTAWLAHPGAQRACPSSSPSPHLSDSFFSVCLLLMVFVGHFGPSLSSHVTYFLHVTRSLHPSHPFPQAWADPQYNRTPCYKEHISLLSPGGIFFPGIISTSAFLRLPIGKPCSPWSSVMDATLILPSGTCRTGQHCFERLAWSKGTTHNLGREAVH